MMIEIDNKVVSSELLERKFCCNLVACKGFCCVHGDSGAPLTQEETEILKKIFSKVKPYMTPAGIKAVKLQGTNVIDIDNDFVTPLIDGKECAYTIFENGTAFCAIERAWADKKIDFQKPVSCHLYPIRVKEFDTFTALNYDVWDVCSPARKLGNEQNIPVYRFLKDAIIRAFGKEFYEQLETAEKLLSSQTNDES